MEAYKKCMCFNSGQTCCLRGYRPKAPGPSLARLQQLQCRLPIQHWLIGMQYDIRMLACHVHEYVCHIIPVLCYTLAVALITQATVIEHASLMPNHIWLPYQASMYIMQMYLANINDAMCDNSQSIIIKPHADTPDDTTSTRLLCSICIKSAAKQQTIGHHSLHSCRSLSLRKYSFHSIRGCINTWFEFASVISRMGYLHIKWHVRAAVTGFDMLLMAVC